MKDSIDSDIISPVLSELEREKDYWVNRLSGEIIKNGFPYDHVQAKDLTYDMDKVSFQIPTEISNRIINISNTSEQRLYIILVTSVIALLYKYSSCNDTIIAAPIYKQEQDGDFINKIVLLKNLINEAASFKDLLLQVRQTVLEAYENQNYQIDQLLEVIAPAKSADFFETVVLLEGLHEKKYIENIPYKILFSFSTNGQGIEGEIKYSPSYYKKETIQSIIHYLIKLLGNTVYNLDIQLNDIELMSEAEKHQILMDFNDTKSDYPQDSTIQQLFEAQVKKAPHNIAVLFEDKKLTYIELWEKSNQLARTLRSKGVKPDSIVGILSERSLEMLIGIFAILKAGGAYLPINPQYPPERIRYMLKDSGAGVLLTTCNTEIVFSMNLTTDEDFHVIDITDPCLYAGDASNIEAINKPTDLAYVIYTSGSTGMPKGVMIEHHSVINRLNWMQKAYPLSEKDIILHKTPFTFDVSVWEILWWSFCGAGVCLLPPGEEKEPEAIANAIKRYKITTMHFVPSMLNIFLGYLKHNGDIDGMSSLKHVFSSGEALGLQQVESFNNIFKLNTKIQLINLYGPTEASIDVSYYNCLKGVAQGKSIPIGKPIDNIRLYILDKAHKLLPIGIKGELYISGVGLARGYLNKPELNNERFVPDAFAPNERMYKTGDIARWLPDGNIEFFGRADFQVKIRGYRIELGEIESLLQKHPMIKECVVVARMDKLGDQYLCAYFVPSQPCTNNELKKYLSEHLPEYMVPAYYVKLTELPLAQNGKLDRNMLPELEASNQREAQYIAPRNEIEESLAEIWRDILYIDKIGIDYNFFEFGGHSLKATNMLSNVEKHFNIRITLKDIFKHTTIRELAKFISQSGKLTYIPIQPVEKKEYYLSSLPQQRMYVLNQLYNNISYNVTEIKTIVGCLYKERVQSAFYELIKRHEALRTSFEIKDGVTVQIIHDNIDFKIDYYESAEDKIDSIIGEYIKSFDLNKPPLLRVGLIKISNNKHVLIFDIHHIISDGVSMEILVREFCDLYAGKTLPPLTLQYKDFAEWQHKMKASDMLKKQESYWLDTYSKGIPVLDLPQDFKRPAMQSFEGDRCSFDIDQRTVSRLKEITASTGATLYMVLLSAYNILLSKYSGQYDIIVGTPIAGRIHADLQNVMGIFINTLALRNFPTADKTYYQFLEGVKQNCLKAYENQHYQFEDLVKILDIHRDLSRNPLFDTMLTFQNMGESISAQHKAQLEGLELYDHEFGTKVSKFDIELIAMEEEGGIRFYIEYCTKLFKRQTIKSFGEHFINIIKKIANNPDVVLSDINIMSDAEKLQILAGFNNNKLDFPKHITVHQLIEAHAQNNNNKRAIVFNKQEITFYMLNRNANRLARYIMKNNLQKEGLVGIMLHRSIDMLEAILAVWKAGGAYLPVDFTNPSQRIVDILEDSETKILLTTSDCINTDLLSMYKGKVILLDKCRDEIELEADDNLNMPVDTNNLAYVIYTSGSTGKPKGAMVEHIGMLNHIYAKINDLGITKDSIIAQTASHCFDISVWQFFTALTLGGETVIYPKETAMDPEKLIKGIIQDRVTVLEIVPSFLTVLLDYVEASKLELKALNVLLVTGETVKPSLVKRWFNRYPNIKMVNAYGPTEASDDITHYIMEKPPEAESIPIGKPVSNFSIYITDNNMKLCPIGVKGEICVSGIGVGRGYLNNPEKTKEVFMEDPFAKEKGVRLYKTGDLGRWLPDGNIEFFGRKDYQVKIRGFRIELGEIENVLSKHPLVKEAVVVDREDNKGSGYLCAYIVWEGKGEIKELREYLQKSLPDYMLPAYFVELEKLPLNPNGKIYRKLLPEPDTDISIATEYEAPRDEREEKLAEVWGEILGRNRIGINDNFFEIGGDSIKAILITTKLQKHGLKLNVEHLFQYPRISEVSAYVEKVIKKNTYYIETGDVQLTPIQKWFFEQQFTNQHQWNQSVFLHSRSGFDENIIDKVFKKIIEQHDALRMIYKLEEGTIGQYNRGLDNECFSIEVADLRENKEAEKEMAEAVNKAQQGIDLESGLMLKLILFKTDDGDHLLIIIHHLIVDGVSWRILLEDFAEGYNQILKGEEISFPDKTSSFRAWAEKLNQYADSEAMLNEKNYWMSREHIKAVALPKDYNVGINKVKDSDTISFSLEQEYTSLLLTEANTAYNTRTNDILLSALGLTINEWTGEDKILVNMEGHGRKDFEDIDISRTVGWFTSEYPVLLEVVEKNIFYSIRNVKETLRGIPNGGIGYGILKYLTSTENKDGLVFDAKPEISFNYMGQFDIEGGELAFTLSPYSTGSNVSTESEMKYTFEINAMVSEGILHIDWIYSSLQYNKAIVQMLTEKYKGNLVKVIEHCMQKEESTITPADLFYKKMSIEDLDNLTDELTSLLEEELV